jgi:hypothetical protein
MPLDYEAHRQILREDQGTQRQTESERPEPSELE